MGITAKHGTGQTIVHTHTTTEGGTVIMGALKKTWNVFFIIFVVFMVVVILPLKILLKICDGGKRSYYK